MSADPTIVQWMVALGLLSLFGWVLLGLFWDLAPTPWNQADAFHKKMIALGLTLVIGLLNFSLARPVLDWVWMGLRHILGMDLEGL